MMHQKSAADTLEQIDRTLRLMAEKGVVGFDCTEKSIQTMAMWGRRPGPVRESLEEIEADIGDCRRCSLSKNRTHIVFGAGDPCAKLVFLGEGPGFEEDRQGKPFVGPAGRLLTRIIEAIQLTRDRVYICNVVKCRPPENRNPLPDEINACFPFLERQLQAIAPRLICALGTFAAQTLLGSGQPISAMRGRFHDWMGIQVLPTYHPAYLLRNPEKKREVWEDMKLLIKRMEGDTVNHA